MQITTVGNGFVITLGWLIAFLILFLVILFLVVGVPDPKVPLLLIGGLAIARLL